MPNEFENIIDIDPPKYDFDFKAALIAAVPRYADMLSPSGLITNIEAYCLGLERDVSLALIDGMSVHDVAVVFDIKPLTVILALEGAIQSIADKANIAQQPPLVETADPYDAPDVVNSSSPGNNWRDLAGCLNTDPELFFAEDEYSQKKAKEICVKCLSNFACLEYAIAGEGQADGIWGGLTTDEREVLMRRRKRTKRS